MNQAAGLCHAGQVYVWNAIRNYKNIAVDYMIMNCPIVIIWESFPYDCDLTQLKLGRKNCSGSGNLVF